MEVRSRPCPTCPYRRDVPSGIWDSGEYEKLRAYDAPTGDQPLAVFVCHSEPEQCCSGWATTHEDRPGHELLALRLRRVSEIPEHGIECFASGDEAADHGLRDIAFPSPRARAAMEKVIRLRTVIGRRGDS